MDARGGDGGSPPDVPGGANTALGPYRSPGQGARFLCIACFSELATTDGDCPRCRVPRHDLARPEVREAVREEAERRLWRRKHREDLALYALAALPALALLVSLLEWLPLGMVRINLLVSFVALVAIKQGLTWCYALLRPGTAHATIAARRLHNGGGIDGRAAIANMQLADEAIADTAGDDPDVADLRRLLVGLGVRQAGAGDEPR